MPQLEVPAKCEVKLEPKGLHLILIDLRSPLVAEKSISLVPTFQSGYRPMLEFAIRSDRGAGHSAH